MADRGRLTIDLGAVKDNYAVFKNQVNEACEVAGVVKANGYGIGALEAAQALIEAGARSFFVANAEEGRALRGAYPDIDIYILGGFFASLVPIYRESRLIPVLNTAEQVTACPDMPVALHIDTGMNRLGLHAADLDWLDFDGLDVKLVMSHFVSSEEAGNPITEKQFKLFMDLAQRFPEAKKSICNSSGVFQGAPYHLDMVRAGVALYGVNPTPGQANPMSNVVKLDVPILQVRRAEAGESVGYNETHEFSSPAVLVTVALGYADGFFRSNSNKANLYWNGTACPVRGRVSMDLTGVEITHIQEGLRPGPGDFLEVIGPHQSVDDLAEAAGTIGYEILTALGRRYERRYI